MACWISDGSSGITINGDIVIHDVNNRKGVWPDDLFNCMWQEGDGVSSGKHYWKVNFQKLEEGGGAYFYYLLFNLKSNNNNK